MRIEFEWFNTGSGNIVKGKTTEIWKEKWSWSAIDDKQAINKTRKKNIKRISRIISWKCFGE